MTRLATTLALLTLAAAPLAAQSRYTLNPTGTEARYQVRELLAANTIENDVVGKTAGVTGSDCCIIPLIFRLEAFVRR